MKSLEAKGARIIGADMLLDQPSEASKDSELKETLRVLSVPVVVVSAKASDGLTERRTAFLASYLDGVRAGIPAISVDSVDGTARAIILRRQHEGRLQLGFVAAIAKALDLRVPDGDSLRLRYRGVPDPRWTR